MYDVDACPVNVSDKLFLDFVLTRAIVKLFKMGSINIIDECYEMFNLKHTSQLISERKCRFLRNSGKGMNFVILWHLINLKTSYHKMVRLHINMKLVFFVHGEHVCMLACIRYTIIVLILLYLSLIQGCP